MFRTLMIGAVSALTLSAAAFAQRRFGLIIAGAALASIFAGLPISTVEAQSGCFAEGMPVLRLDDNGNPVFWIGCSFTSLMDQTLFTLNGLLYRVENASQPWSCEQYDTNLFRFELRSGDIWPNPGGFTERTEVSAGGVLYPPGTVVTITYDFTLEPGPTNIAPWLVIGQWHSTYMPTAPQPDHPPVGLFLMGDDRLQVLGVWAETGSTTENDMTLYVDPNPMQRGQTYAMTIVTNFMNDATGFVQVWRDGVQLVDYSGPIGYGQATYWKEGIYRYPTDQTIAAWYENTIQTPSQAPPGSPPRRPREKGMGGDRAPPLIPPLIPSP